MIRLSPIFLLTVFFSFALLAQDDEEQPYWRKRPNLYNKVLHERKVLVSVKTQKENKIKTIKMRGVGVAQVPLHVAKKEIMNFESLPQVSSHFDEVTHDREKKVINILASALGYQTRLILKYSWQDKEKHQQMDWIAIGGPFKGMVGHFQMLPVSAQKTEIVLWSSFESTHIPIPAFILNITLEVICEKVAQKMRAFIESSYKKSFVSLNKNNKE